MYKLEYGHVDVPKEFVVPHEEPWPVEIRGLNLGARCSHIRNRGDYPQYRSALDEIGFSWVAWRDKSFKEIFFALENFQTTGKIPPEWEGAKD